MPKINFTGNWVYYLRISVTLIVVIPLLIYFEGVGLDIQFKGGSIITYAYEGELNTDDFADAFTSILSAESTFQESENIATGQKTIVASIAGQRSLNAEEMVSVNDALNARFPENNLETLEISNVDPAIGKEFLMKCITAVVFASILMVIYVALRFRKIGGLSAGAMAIVALVHDVIIVFGVFVACKIPINYNFIAVILTIIGYSLNDTIVIYDRIRENERIHSKIPISELVNLSINQSFKRTLMTSITTVMAMTVVTIVASVYGVSSIFSFSFPLIIGLVSGSYSSVCLAGPLWVKWQERQIKKNGAAGMRA